MLSFNSFKRIKSESYIFIILNNSIKKIDDDMRSNKNRKNLYVKNKFIENIVTNEMGKMKWEK